MLTAIEPDGDTKTRTFSDSDDALQFIRKQNETKNVYYQANPTKAAVTSKARKEDIAQVEYLHVDADPREDETPETFKARISLKIDAFAIKPTFVHQLGQWHAISVATAALREDQWC